MYIIENCLKWINLSYLVFCNLILIDYDYFYGYKIFRIITAERMNNINCEQF